MVTISRLLEKKLRLYIKKTSLIGRVFSDKPHYLLNYKDINALRTVIAREIMLNKRLLRYTKRYAELKSAHLEPIVVKFEEVTRDLILVLGRERKVLSKIGLLNLFLHEIGVLVFRKSRSKYFDMQFYVFQQLHKREQELDVRLFTVVSQRKEGLIVAKVKAYQKIASDIQRHSKALLGAVGNNALVRKNAHEILVLIGKLQGMELYTYMHSDIMFIKNQVKDVMNNPSKSKIKTFLAGAYILTPGSFETTTSILLVKNLTKFTVRKISRRPRNFSRKRAS